ncbi:MAG: hypothetical protein WBS22_04365, partial [Methylocystis sp.]
GSGAGGSGGGSFLASSVTELIALSGVNAGNGSVDIALTPGPRPGQGLAALALLLLAGAAAAGRRSLTR